MNPWLQNPTRKKMSHRKVHSQGSVPFSWEDSPGVCKLIHSPIDTDLPPPPFPQDHWDTSTKILLQDDHMKIPLPPGTKAEPPRRSTSTKGFRFWHEDPFLAAYKECTKNAKNGKLASETESKKNVGSRVRKSRFMFSCKNSCDVKEDSLVRLPNLPPIPRVRER